MVRRGIIKEDYKVPENQANSVIQLKTRVAVLAESIPLEVLQLVRKYKQSHYLKMRIFQGHHSDMSDQTVKEVFIEKGIIFNDKSPSYVNVGKHIKTHITEISVKNIPKTTFQRVHIAISNLKRTFLGIFHKVKGKYLQNDLD